MLHSTFVFPQSLKTFRDAECPSEFMGVYCNGYCYWEMTTRYREGWYEYRVLMCTPLEEDDFLETFQELYREFQDVEEYADAVSLRTEYADFTYVVSKSLTLKEAEAQLNEAWVQILNQAQHVLPWASLWWDVYPEPLVSVYLSRLPYDLSIAYVGDA
jgi:hypothetical protein